MEKLKRYLIFLIGLFISSLGVSFVTKANLGTSPISSIPYVLSLKLPWTLGNFTIVFSCVLILLQILLLRKRFKLESLLQIPVSIFFGYFIDITMLLLQNMNPSAYYIKVIDLLIGCLILAFGVYLEVIADVVMLPGESLVRAIVTVKNTNFGNTKVAFDASITVIAAVLSFVFFGKLNGVREGTLICALLVGFIARLFGRYFKFLENFLFPGLETVTDNVDLGDNHVIVISRQYGSGGVDLGRMLADELGFDFYDQETSVLASTLIGMPTEYVTENEEQMENNLLYDLKNQMYIFEKGHQTPKDKIFEAEEKVIQDLAKKGNCIIVGRCADHILRSHKKCFTLFLHADMEERIKRVAAREHINTDLAKALIIKQDKVRSNNYLYYTHRPWGNSSNFNLAIDTTPGLDYTKDIILYTFKQFQNQG